MKVHEEIEEWLAAAVTEGLSEEEREQFQKHLDECESCRELNEEEQLMSKAIDGALAGIKPDGGFEDRVVAGFRRRTAGRKDLRLAGLLRIVHGRPLQWAVAAAIILALIKVGALLTGERLRPYGTVAERERQFQAEPDNSAAKKKLEARNQVSLLSPTTTAGDKRMAANSIDALRFNADGSFMGKPLEATARRPKSAQIEAPASPAADSPDTDKEESTETSAPEERKLIRNASLEFEVKSFDAAGEAVRGITGEEGGYIATMNSTRGANGKLLGTIVAKVPPVNLDSFLTKVRVLGDLKGQTIGTEDVTKAYYDTEARMRNAKRMEERLLDMLQKATGKVSELLQVEKEINRVREEIEQMQGQLKYYDTLARYATVTLSIYEKDLNTPAAFLLKERSALALFSPDVEKSYAEAKNEAAEADAQIVRSNLERDSEGRTIAMLTLLLKPETADQTIGRMKALGRVRTFTTENERIAQEGSGASDTAKVEREKVEFNLQIVQDDESAVERTSLSVLSGNVEEGASAIKDSAAAENVAVKSSTFEREANGAAEATLVFRLTAKEEGRFLEQIKRLGKVSDLTVHRDDATEIGGEGAPAEITLRIYSRGDIVPDENGVWATSRRTFAQAFGAVMWSARMIGVALAFVIPWGIAAGALLWLCRLVARRRK